MVGSGGATGRRALRDRQLSRSPGRKLVDRFDGDTYRILAGAMDLHDIGDGRGGIEAAFGLLAERCPGDGRGHPGRHPVRPAPGARAGGRRDRRGRGGQLPGDPVDKGHDAFLVEWDQFAPSSTRRSRPDSAAGSRSPPVSARDARYCTRAPHGPFDALVPVRGPPRPPPRRGGDGLGHGGRPGLTVVDPGGRPEPIAPPRPATRPRPST